MPPISRLTVLLLLLAAGPAFSQVSGAAPDKRADVTEAAPATPGARPKPTRNAGFYKAEVSVNSENDAERRGATIRALAQVLVRLTGNPQAGSNSVVRRASGNVEALVLESSIRQDPQTINGVPTFKSILAVSFDPDAVDALVAGAGLRFWTSSRPKPILWLAIDDGRGPRLVTGQQTKVVKPLADRGLERGMRYLLPAGTTAEQAAVPSIFALNGTALQPLTNRYGNDVQLLGKVYRKPPGWAADWLLMQGGTELARWSFADADPRRVIASGVDEGANAIAKRDSVSLDAGAAGPQQIEVAGVNTQSDYVRLMAYLQTMAVVRKVSVLEAQAGRVRLQVDLGVGLRGFLPMVAGGNVLVPSSEASSGAVIRFNLQ
jgi:hypothetical protein